MEPWKRWGKSNAGMAGFKLRNLTAKNIRKRKRLCISLILQTAKGGSLSIIK
jgi:hypothetical protein